MKPYAFGVDAGGPAIQIGLFQTTGHLVEKWTIPTRIEDHGSNILPDIVSSIQKKVEQELDEAWAYAEAAPYSQPEVAMEHIYAEC